MLFLNASIANACLARYPNGKRPLKDEIRMSDVIYRGTLSECFVKDDKNILKFTVKDVWKGDAKPEYTFLTRFECDSQFIEGLVGKDFLRFATLVKGTPHLGHTATSTCGIGRSTGLKPKWKGDRMSLWKRLTTKDNRHPDIIALGTPLHSFK